MAPMDGGEIHSVRPIRLIVGLGNPGKRYAGTRHNAGFDCLGILAARWSASFAERKDFRCELAVSGGLILMKPLTYMNLSGEAWAHVSRFYRCRGDETLVVLDDTALPLGRLRLRKGGSAGGHNGLRSLIAHVGSPELPRLRIGVGAAAGTGDAVEKGAEREDQVGHVLGKFSREERPIAERAFGRAADAVQIAIDRGLEAAMNIYNQPEPVG